jgi:nitrate/TMAO reductase-like tetraheme cytochrome c subunit
MNFLRLKKGPLLLFVLLLTLSSIAILKGEDEEEEHNERRGKSGEVYKLNNRTGTMPVMNQKFKAECTSCHMLYQPSLLPAKSWTKMMSNLKEHFGENAELDPAVQKEITDFLVKNSSNRFNSNQDGIRISETTYFKRKHDEISPSVFKRKGIGSAANCLACHSGAENNNFDEDNVRIPKETAVKIKK